MFTDGLGDAIHAGSAPAQPQLVGGDTITPVPESRRSRRIDNRSETASGVPKGLPGEINARSLKLESGLRRFAKDGGESPRFRTIKKDSLPDALSGAIAEFERFTGNRVDIIRNLNGEQSGIDFNGVTMRDGTLYVDEASQHPATTIAAHG